MANKKTDLLIHNMFQKNLLTVFWQELMFALGTLIDGVITCRFLGSMGMAAVGVCSPFASILAVFSGMIGIGCQAGCSEKIGEGKPQEANAVYSTLLALSVLVSGILILVFFFFAAPIAISWGAGKASSAEDDIITMAAGYLRACSFGIPGMVIFYVLSPALILDGKRKYIKYSALAMIGINIAGDLLNVFLFHGGTAGMGAATSVSCLVSFLILVYGMLKTKGMFDFRFSDIHISYIPQLLYYGVSKAIRRACNALRPIFLNQVIAALCGSTGLAVLSVQGNLRAFQGVISAAIAGTMLSIAGVFYHEQDHKGIRHVFLESIRADLFIAVPLALIFLIGARFFVGLYVTDSSEVEEMAVFAVRCYAAALPFVVFNEIYINYFQSIGDVPKASLLSFLSRVGIIAPCGIFALYQRSIRLAFFALFSSELILSLLIFLYLLFFEKGNHLIDKLMVYTKNFDKNIRREKTIPTTTLKEALASAPMEIYHICEEWEMDKIRANRGCLICEEFLLYLNNDEENSDRNVSIRIIEKDDDSVVLFIRNDCKLSNIEAEMDEHLTDKSYIMNALSERILMFEVDSYNYKNTFGLNHAVFTIS